MKVFALITAALMATGGAAYYLHSDSMTCPLAKSGGCCSTGEEKPVCCETPCPACATDCLTCCDSCEVCCTTGVQSAVSAVKVSAKSECCAAGATKVAVAKVEAEDCCAACTSPARVVTAAAAAGIGAK